MTHHFKVNLTSAAKLDRTVRPPVPVLVGRHRDSSMSCSRNADGRTLRPSRGLSSRTVQPTAVNRNHAAPLPRLKLGFSGEAVRVIGVGSLRPGQT